MKIFELMKTEPDEVLWEFANDVHTAIVDLYFSKYWISRSYTFEQTGDALIKKVNDLNPESVLDAGCGTNYFKGKIQNLIGIDPFSDAADVKQDFSEYYLSNPGKQFDVVLALGSVNFGLRDKILFEVDLLDKMTKSGGHQFWRVNAGRADHDCDHFPLANLIDFYPWNKDFVEEIAKIYNYEILEFGFERNITDHERVYFTFYKY